MKRLVYILVLSLVFACDSENVNDCFQTSGVIIQQEVKLDSFTKILVNKDVELILKDGSPQKIIVETGKNLINDVVATVIDDQLILTDNNSCNFVRDYGVTKVYVTSPNIIEIRSSTQYDIRSDGVLTYRTLRLFSEGYRVPGTITSGNFNLEVDNIVFSLLFNNLSNCFVSGHSENLEITFSAGSSRFEGGDLIAEDVVVINRGSNDMIVNPQKSLTGSVLGTGDVISVNTPPVVEIEEAYKGRLIFE